MDIENPWWGQLQRSYCFPDHCNCEMIHLQDFILQPMAFWSNIPFILVGLYLLRSFRRQSHVDYKRLLLAVNFVLIGFASFFFHASMAEIAVIMDFGSIFLFFAWVATALCFPRLDLKRFIIVWVGLAAIPTLIIAIFRDQRINAFAVLLAPIVVMLLRFHKKHPQTAATKKYLQRSMLIMILAIFCVLTDRWRLFCFDEWHLHGHSLWHILDAISLYYIYRYFEYHQEHAKHL